MARAGNSPPLRTGQTGFHRSPGNRVMKEYPLTSRELWTLGGLQAGSALALSIAGWLWGFWVSAKQTIAFADKKVIAGNILGQWQGYADMAWVGMIAVGALGILLIVLSAINVIGIIRDTTHD